MPLCSCNTRCLSEAHQLGYRNHTKFLHYTTAVDLYRFFCNAEFPGNLFVQHARNNDLHQFKLARRQHIEKTPALILFSSEASLFGRARQSVLNTFQ